MRGNWMAVILIGLPLASCQTYGNDQMSQYLQRKEGVTLSAGDANSTNAAAMALHPWPPGVGDRHIPAQGSRMVTAAKTYRCEGVDNRGPVQTNSQTTTKQTPGGAVSQTTSETGRSKADKTSDC